MLNGIQILRAMAALGVVLFHSAIYIRGVRELTPWVDFFTRNFGHGVMLFFAISGFVLWPIDGKPKPLEFLKRRLLRIYPPFLLCCAVALGLKWALHIGSYDWLETLKALSLWPFGPIPYPLSVEWSLVYEMFFYWVLFGLCFVARARTRQWLLGAWCVFLIASAFAMPQATVSLPTVDQIAVSAFSLPFVMGALFRILFEHLKTRQVLPQSAYWALWAAAIVSLVVAHEMGPQAICYLFWGLGFSLITLLAALHPKPNDKSVLRLLGKWGDCSYGTYLIHFQAVGAFVRLMRNTDISVNALFATTVVFALLVGGIFGWAEFRFHQWMTKRQRN
jgi:exopolysaccharide production protein ExoZ